MISGPSGVGKSSIIDAVLERTPSVFSVSCTTRAPRPGEVEGVDYHFVTRSEFESRLSSGEILESTEYGGNLYGTLREVVESVLTTGQNVILDIENEGARQVRATYADAVLIFIAPPNLTTLARRLEGRGDTMEHDMAMRLAVAAEQMAEAPELYDHIVENRKLSETIDQVLDILIRQDADPSAS